MLNHKAADLRSMGKVAEADEALAAVQPKWSGTMAYRAVIPADMLRSKHPRHRVLTTPHIVGAIQVYTFSISDALIAILVSGTKLRTLYAPTCRLLAAMDMLLMVPMTGNDGVPHIPWYTHQLCCFPVAV